MKITIDVTDKLFGRDITNCFQDFFSRVIADTVQDMNNDHIGLCGRYELETATFLKEAFARGTYNEETLTDTVADLTDRHWNECRQIALYDDELKKALALLKRVKRVHRTAILNGDAAVSSLTSPLLHEIEKLEKEIAASKGRHTDG